MKKYSKEQFKVDRVRLAAIVGNKLDFISTDPGTYRVTYGDDVLRIYFDIYLSKHTVVVRRHYGKPLYYRKQSWEQISSIIDNLGNIV